MRGVRIGAARVRSRSVRKNLPLGRPFVICIDRCTQSVAVGESSTEVSQPTFETSTATPHGDASVTGTSVVLEGASRPNKATKTRNIVFVASEVTHGLPFLKTYLM